jgi:hypothetical protein
MQKNISSTLEDSTLPSKLKFVEGSFKYVYMFSTEDYGSGIGVTELYKISNESRDKIASLLKGGDAYTPVSGDKIYLLPDSKIPSYKIKEYCKSSGLTITTVIEKATVILGTEENILDPAEYDNGKYQYPHGCIVGEHYSPSLTYNQALVDFIKNRNTFNILPSTGIDYHEMLKPDDTIVVTRAICSHYSTSAYTDNLETPITQWALNAESLTLVYNILSKKVPVISQEHFIETCGNQVSLDEDMYNSLDMMFSSPSQEDHLTAAKILFNCNTKDSIYHVWRLAKKHSHRIDNSENNRLKEAKLFKSLVSWSHLEDLDNNGILTHLAKRGQLVHDVFYKLINDIVDEETDRAARRLDLSHVIAEITPKYNYEEFIKPYGQQNSN